MIGVISIDFVIINIMKDVGVVNRVRMISIQ